MRKRLNNNGHNPKKSQINRGRKSPRGLSVWEGKFKRKLRKHHKHFAKKVFHRLMKKSSTLRTTLKRRSKEYEVEFNISLTEVRELVHKSYGRKCRYCDSLLLVNNMACDHVHPLSMGGNSTPANLQMICMRCNTRKGPLTDRNFKKILRWLEKQELDLRKYVLRKLSSRDF